MKRPDMNETDSIVHSEMEIIARNYILTKNKTRRCQCQQVNGSDRYRGSFAQAFGMQLTALSPRRCSKQRPT